ncbi:hypothetical protein FKG94_13080 [Exilibacterium tricleocarpae]|uniref:Uncharacterized protein n=1 Tax=Exilibacterium tricleocarpae TaxID=2591008 RepID=A0A545TLB2_9GAMM|nr:hypothetical protein [Exilibacterium tricleocarpae]TQV78014.1 hypothetical protein FKG94_13080 [Exilibacterium tricleocarpae]
MRPANAQQAVQHMEHLLARKLTGKRSSRVREHLNRAKRIAAIIHYQFQVGPYQYQVKHLRWYLATQTAQLKPAARYRHWLTIKYCVYALNKEAHWMGVLQGSWQTPATIKTLSNDEALSQSGQPTSL